MSLRLFGPLQYVNDNAVTSLRWQLPTALISFLATQPGWVSRDELAILLRPDDDEESAKAYLRRLIHRTREQPWAAGLEVEPQRVCWRDDSDVRRFRRAMAVSDWQSALTQYQGRFLEGAGLLNVPPIDDWLEATRLELHSQWRQCVLKAVDTAPSQERLPLIQKLLQADTLDEEAVQLYLSHADTPSGQHDAMRTFTTFRQRLETEMQLAPLASTTRLAEQVRVSLAENSLEPTKPNTPTKPSNLPQDLTPFVVRDDDLRRLHTKLDTPGCRLLTLLGPGGNGKTRLLIRLCRERQARYPDGSYFVSLVNAHSEEDLVLALSTALGIGAGGPDPLSKIVTFLSDKSVLLALDNMEQLTAASSPLLRLLEQATELQIVITSREALNLPGEWLYEVRGLSYPQGVVGNPESYAAIQLLRLSAERHGVTPQAGDTAALVRICQLVEGSPLALELAGSWIKLMSFAEIADEIGHNLDFLASTGPVAGRHTSMRAVFQGSWQRLSASQQQRLAALSVFSGGFDRQAAEQVAGADVRMLLELVQKSLLRRRDDGRYDLHPLIQQFAHTMLTDEQRRKLQQSHAQYYLTFLARETALQPGRYAKMTHLTSQFANIRSAWETAVWFSHTELLQAAQPNLTLLLLQNSQFTLGRVLLEAAGQITQDTQVLARFQAAQAVFLHRLGQLDAAEALADQCLLVLSDPVDRISPLVTKISVSRAKGQLGEAKHYAEAVLDQAQQAQDPAYQAMALMNLAVIHRSLGALETSDAYARASLAISHTHGLDKFLAHMQQHLALTSWDRGDVSRVQAPLLESLKTFRDNDDAFMALYSYVFLSHLMQELDEPSAQLQYAQSALQLAGELGLTLERGMGLVRLGWAYLANQQLQDALECFRQSLTLALTNRYRSMIDQSLAGYAKLFEHSQRQTALLLLQFILAQPDLHPLSRPSYQKQLEAMNPSPLELTALTAQVSALERQAIAEELLHGNGLYGRLDPGPSDPSKANQTNPT